MRTAMAEEVERRRVRVFLGDLGFLGSLEKSIGEWGSSRVWILEEEKRWQMREREMRWDSLSRSASSSSSNLRRG